MIEKINPVSLIDFYKADHASQYPEGTELVYSNFTARNFRNGGLDGHVVFGIQYFIKEYLIDRFDNYFFKLPLETVIRYYTRLMTNALGPNKIDVGRIASLHNLGYLPIRIKALEEGSICPEKIPCVTIQNTKPEFFWLTNYFETLMSSCLWKPMTSATTAFQYRKEFERHAKKTGYDASFIGWQGHDFSFRGMSGTEDAMISAAGHALSFAGSDTVPVIDFLEMFYNADSDKELIVGSVPASEHSVMAMGMMEHEYDTFDRLIFEVYPDGIASVVSDTYDFWKIMTEYLPSRKDRIMARNGRTVFRPDSGLPEDIICGNPLAETEEERKGAYQIMWEIFGGTVSEQGYKILDGHIGLIYGDSITLSRQKEILRRLEEKGFSASNLVLGIGSFTYEYVTRDILGFAMKATYGVVNGEPRNIFKKPKTDTGFKNSAKGLLRVNEDYTLKECCSPEEEQSGLLKTVFEDGKLIVDESLSVIRQRLLKNL